MMIADTRSVTTCNVAIRQIFSYRSMSIRDRTIIKVTAQNNTLFFMLLNVFCYSLSLKLQFLCFAFLFIVINYLFLFNCF